MSTLQTFRRHRKPLGGALAALMAVWQIGQPLQANDWDGSTDNAWTDGTNWSGGVPTGSQNLLFGLGQPNRNIIVGSGSLANSLSFMDNYSLSTNDLTLTSGNVRVGLGYDSVINSTLSGTGGLNLTDGGSLRLTNAANDYTGVTTISNGSLIISSQDQLGDSASEIVVTGTNPVIGSTNLRGFGGGALVLDGTSAGFTLSRDLSLQGFGPLADRSAALISYGNNTLSGAVTMGEEVTASVSGPA